MNGIIVLNKPIGKTSHDMVSAVRRLTGVKKVGHTGTLDPYAEGVLPICVGNATKAAELITAADKRYTAELILGMTTDTLDSEGEVLTECGVYNTKEEIEEAILSFTGESEQIPPMYSAVKKNGKKLYELARAGISVERESRRINIYSINIRDIDMDEYKVTIDVHCSKGTYIRTLCEDIGIKLGVGAYMNRLKRTASGAFGIESSYSMEELYAMKDKGTLNKALMGVDEVFDYPRLTVSHRDRKRVVNGARIDGVSAEDGRMYRLYDENGEFLCISKCEKGTLKLVKAFWER